MAALACVAFMLIDVLGLRLSSRVNSVLVVVKVSVLVLFIALTLPHFHASNLNNMLSKGYEASLRGVSPYSSRTLASAR